MRNKMAIPSATTSSLSSRPERSAVLLSGNDFYERPASSAREKPVASDPRFSVNDRRDHHAGDSQDIAVSVVPALGAP
jgi:hypothetical protein